MSRKREISLVLALAMIGSVLLVPVGNVEADQSATDSFGYRWTDSSSPDPTVSYNWIDISGTGTDTLVDGDDDYGGPFPIGFDFPFYGNLYTDFYVSTNGIVSFGSGSWDYGNDPIPSSSSPDNIIAAYWDDLYVDSGELLYRTIGSAPNQQCVIEYYTVNRLGNSNQMTFEIILNETSEVWIQYNTMNGMTGTSATVGIENSDGSMGTEYSYNSASLSDALAVMFSVAPVALVPSQLVNSGYPGDTMFYTLTVRNNQPMTDSFDINYTSVLGFTVDIYDSLWNPLVDNNGNTVPDTGDVTMGGTVDIHVAVAIPLSPSDRQEITTVRAHSYNDPANYDTSDLTTNVFAARLVPFHSDFGWDDDGDTHYDFLCVNVSVEVFFTDWYYVDVYLSDDTWSYVDSQFESVLLDPGFHQITVYFSGYLVYSHGLNCSYFVDMYLYDGSWTYLGYDFYMTNWYNYDEFDVPDIEYAPPHSDHGFDTDGDSYYNYMVVNVSLDVHVAGTYIIDAYLYTGTFWYICGTSNSTYLDVGIQTVPVLFSGPDIRLEGYTGTFVAELYLYDASLDYLGFYSYTTGSYAWDEFQSALSFSPPHADYGQDDNGDSLYDYLVVAVIVNVAVADWYWIFGDLYDSGSGWIDSYSYYGYFSTGMASVDLYFGGLLISDNGVDGPYTVDLYAYDDSWWYMDGDTHTTAAYAWSEFQLPVVFVPPHLDYGYDSGIDGKYDWLIVEVDLTVSVAGYYTVYGDMFDSLWNWLGYDSTGSTYLGAGVQTVELWFDGSDIRQNGVDGPYTVYLYVDDDWGTTVDSDVHVTAAYTWDEFQPPPIEFNGVPTDYGSDVDSDMLYEYLVIEFMVDISIADYYYFEASVYDSGPSLVYIAWEYIYLDVGTQTVILSVPGQILRNNGDSCSYSVDMRAYDDWYVLWDSLFYVSNYYTWDEFGPLFLLTPPHSDYGQDDNGDSLYDYLVVEVSVNVDAAGWYYVEGVLYDSTLSYIDSYVYYGYLDAGTSTIELYFSGLAISDNGVDGPYTVDLYAYDDSWWLLDSGTHPTAAYGWTEFQTPGAELWPPHLDYGLDTNGDSYFDYLVVEVTLEVAIAGDYEVDAWLYDWWGSYIDYDYTVTYLDTGTQTVELYFSGWDIRENMEDGPFDVQLYLYDGVGSFLDYDLHSTSSYAWTGFQPGIAFLPPHTDYGQDDNGDSLYDYLVVEAIVDVIVAGWYWIFGDLYDSGSSWIGAYSYYGYLDVGPASVNLYFDGFLISDNGVDGPYTVDLSAYDDSWWYMDGDTHTTAAYAWSEFQMPGAEFWPPYSDYGLDMNGDTYYDYLVIELQINVSIAGSYEVVADLYSPLWSYIGSDTEEAYYVIGVHTVEMVFPGYAIYYEMENGQFHVEANLYYADGPWLDYDTHLTSSYNYDEFSPPGGSFGWPHSDYGLDTNDDLLYDYLVVEVTVDVVVAGTYEVAGWLYDWWGSYVDDAYNWTYLDTGTQTVELYFSGWEIRQATADSPFDVYLELTDSFYNYLDSDWHTTSSYVYTEFQTSPGVLEPPHSDYGLDQNGDSLYDYLVIEVQVNVSIPGEFAVEGFLDDALGSFIGYTDVYVYLDAGVQTVELWFDGWDIREGWHDGPYDVDINLYNSEWSWLDNDIHTTAMYAYDEFQTYPALFSPPHDDYGLSTGGDSLFEYLVVEVFVDVAVSGAYTIEATLYDPFDFVDYTAVHVDLGVGLQTVELWFHGWQILASGEDGPYDVEFDLFINDWAWLDYGGHTTDAYAFTDFDGTLPSTTSYWTASAPAIDGVYSPDEWADAVPVDLLVSDPTNDLGALLLIMNNGTHLFICYDATGDLTQDANDAASVSFDTGNDGMLTHLHEDQFCVGGTDWFPNEQAHYVFDSVMDQWIVHCTPLSDSLVDHEGLATARGFGTSDNLASDHRVYEFAIPLALLGLTPGDVAGFVGRSDNAPGVFDESEWTYSAWPVFMDSLPSPQLYGDLVLSSSAPPTTTAGLTGTMGENGWYISGVQVALTASDAEEGVNYTMYRINGGAWQTYTSSVIVSAGGSYALDYYSVDLGGNIEITRTVTFRIDTVAPTTTAYLTGTAGENGWYTSQVSVRLSATDGSGGSGVDDILYRIGTGAWTPYTGAQLVFTENGTFTVEFYSEDLASNDETTKSVTFRIDTVAPVTTATADGAKVTLVAEDSTSGVNRTMYRIDGGDWMVYTGEITVEGKGNHTVEFYSVDEAGNSEAVQTIVVDVPSGGILGSSSWLWILIIIAAAAAAVSLFVIFGMKRKPKGPAPSTQAVEAPPEQQQYPGQEGPSPYDEALSEDEGATPPPA